MSVLKQLVFTVSIYLLTAHSVAAQLNASQSRRLIARIAGAELPTNAIRVKRISNGSSPEVTAEIQTAFRFEQNADGHWTVREVRVAPDRWEDVGVFSEATGAQSTTDACTVAEPAEGGTLSVRRARCLLAALFHVTLPSDNVRISSLSAMNIPFATSPSATVVASVTLDFRFAAQARDGMQVVAIRGGSSSWIEIARVRSNVDQIKRRRALAELQTVADALGQFRLSRGHYVQADKHTVLVDFLSPMYLSRVIRVDPWHTPYEYLGERDRFTLRSAGPDRKPNTPDDLLVSNP